ncbi:TIGR03085 family metal-binding protein [Rothia nasimurium]|uniref:TIGR03085 family metal-binding protein n=1 Tax=Rothia nasimurium TaxID=85336 RepID=UPI001F014563|nr:TIGR03085 family metal-binding protein [Rothia nasimurium]
MTSSALVTSERTALLDALAAAGPSAPTLCEGWETRHLATHLLVRESKPLIAAGMPGGPLAARTERYTKQLADELTGQRRYEKALRDFEALPGYLHMRTRFPGLDEAMNLIEYFVHTEDVRRASLTDGEQPAPRELAEGVQEKMWKVLRARARMMAGKKYPQGLVLEAPGYSPAVHTVIAPPAGQVATVLTGEPGELVLYMFGREAAARVEVS